LIYLPAKELQSEPQQTALLLQVEKALTDIQAMEKL
jgi:hypothetical protein